MFRIIALASAAAVLAGCAGNPKTSAELREVARGGHMLLKKPESFVVDRPFAAVAATFRKRAPDCLDIDRNVQQTPTIGFAGSPRLRGGSRSTLLVSGQTMELALRISQAGDLSKDAESRDILFVADAEAVGPGKTRIDIYRTAVRSDALYEAVRGWAEGTTQGCPDPQTFL
jgi:hypothetical protein